MITQSNIDKVNSLHPDIIFNFLETGQSKGISNDLQLFIKQIQWASEIWETERNTTRAARKLRERILAMQDMKISIVACKSRLYQAMEYFHVEHNIAQEIWDRNAADKFEDLFKLAIKQDKLNEAGRFLEKANELRRRANSALNVDDLKLPDFLITNKITSNDLGYPNKKMLDISKKATDGYYTKLINDLPIDEKSKKQLRYDADIQDVDFEELDGQ